MDAYLISLCRDYIDLVDGMRNGRYTTEEVRQLDSQRLVLHDQLCQHTGFDRSLDMYAYARRVVHAARAGGQ